MLTYTGKVLNYILATPERPDDGDNPLRLAIGNEASVRDIRDFARRFGCTVRDSYGSTEGIIIIRRDPSMPEGGTGDCRSDRQGDRPGDGCGVPAGGVRRRRPADQPRGRRRRDRRDPADQRLRGLLQATRRPRTARFRDGWYWSGDLAYRDADGWLYFAGRSNEWLRVDGENFAAAPVEAIVARHPDVRSVAVYAVPDDPVGDRVMAALELTSGCGLRPGRVRRVPGPRSPIWARNGDRRSCG